MGTDTHEASGLPTRRALIGSICVEVLDSGPTQWVFDLVRRRFVSLAQEVDLDAAVLNLPWEPYERLDPTHDGRGVVVTTKRATVRKIHVPAC